MEKISNIKTCWIGALIISAFFVCSQASSYAMEVTLQWYANTEPDLDGYKVYYKTGSSGPPYNGPIVVGNTTTYELTGLDNNEVYFFVVIAYDTEGLESDYSNEVSTSQYITLILKQLKHI